MAPQGGGAGLRYGGTNLGQTVGNGNERKTPMKPFARISLSSVLSSVALAKEETLAKADALRRGSGTCENVQISNTNNQLPMNGN